MKQLLRKNIAFALAASVMLSACAQGLDDPNLSPEERKLREMASSYNETIGEGALIGCILGTIGGLLLSGKNNMGQGAAIGCAGGAALGGGAGVYIANKQEKYATREMQLDAMVKDVRVDNQNLASAISSAHNVVADNKRKIDQIDKQLASGAISLSQAKSEMARVDSNKEAIEKLLSGVREKQQQYAMAQLKTQGRGTRQQDAAMNQEMETLKKQVGQLEGELNSLVSRRNVSRVG